MLILSNTLKTYLLNHSEDIFIEWQCGVCSKCTWQSLQCKTTNVLYLTLEIMWLNGWRDFLQVFSLKHNLLSSSKSSSTKSKEGSAAGPEKKVTKPEYQYTTIRNCLIQSVENSKMLLHFKSKIGATFIIEIRYANLCKRIHTCLLLDYSFHLNFIKNKNIINEIIQTVLQKHVYKFILLHKFTYY